MSDDLNTPRAVAALFGFLSFIEKSLKSNLAVFSAREAQTALQTFQTMDKVFGIFYEPKNDYFGLDSIVATQVEGKRVLAHSNASLHNSLWY
jgi:hypothetical protein